MKLEIPEGYTLPEDVQDGGTLEELVTFKVEGEYLVPTMIAGVEIPTESEDEGEDMGEEEVATAEMEAGASPMRGMGERIMGMA